MIFDRRFFSAASPGWSHQAISRAMSLYALKMHRGVEPYVSFFLRAAT